MQNQEAIKALEFAIKNLEAAKDALWTAHTPDTVHYAISLQEMLSCDHGEAGMRALLKVLKGA